MPIHDWSRVEAGIFHDFHQAWTITLRNALNHGALPPNFFAMTEQVLGGPIPDVITLHRPAQDRFSPTGGVAVADAPPRTRFHSSAEPDVYAAKANRLAIKHRLGHVVAIIEILSPGNKGSRNALRQFVDKTRALLDQGIHLLVIDLFPPSSRDPQGIHKAIWDEIAEEPFELPADKPLTVVAYDAGPVKKAYVEPVAVGDALPEAPLFLAPGWYVPAPLEATYQSTWDLCPAPMKELVEKEPS